MLPKANAVDWVSCQEQIAAMNEAMIRVFDVTQYVILTAQSQSEIQSLDYCSQVYERKLG